MSLPAVRRITYWMPMGLLAAGVVVNVADVYDFTGSPFFTAAPLAAAPFSSALRTGVIGAVAVGVLCLLVAVNRGEGARELVLAFIVAITAVLALGINLLARRRVAALDSARTIAEAAQLAVLPTPPPRLGGLDIAARYRAAQSGARIGGDLYAVQETPYGTRMIIGDVRGKGMGAVETVVILIGAFREAAEQEETLEALTARLERALQRESERRRDLDAFEGFTTVVIAEIPAAHPETLRFVNRGHPSPLLVLDGRSRFCEPREFALPLGVPALGAWPDRVDEVPFPGGAQLLLYTDGLSESRNRGGEFYQPDVRLSGSVFEGPDDLLDTVLTDVDVHTRGEAGDDMALLAVQRTLNSS